MPEQKSNPAAAGPAAPTGAGSRGPTPEQERRDRQVEAASAAPGERRSASRPLKEAAASGHPEVHKALADLETSRLNLEAAKAEERDEEAEQARDDALGRLKDLGYE